MRRWSIVGLMPRLCPWCLACALACTFDASGQGEAPASMSTGGAATSDAVDATGPGATTTTTGGPGSGSGTADATTWTTGEGVLTDASTSTTTGTTDATTSSTGSTTGEPPPPDTTGPPVPPSCDGMFVKQIRLVSEAQVFPPMVAQQSQLGEGTLAFSQIAEQGTITFTFDVPCAGAFAVWGRVLDVDPGVNNYDPDSYYVHVDGAPESGWFYGCQTDQKPAGYSWLRVRTGEQGIPCDETVPLLVDLAAGVHTITLRNREQQDGDGNVAAVARLLIVNDPNYTPVAPD